MLQNPIYKSNTDQGKAINLFNSIWIPLQETNKGLNLAPYLAKIDVKNIQDLQKLS
jgi:endothelin-converting enzyme/putative endopeptidase